MREIIDLVEGKGDQPQHEVMWKVKKLAQAVGLEVFPSFDGERITADPDHSRTTLQQFGQLITHCTKAFNGVKVDYAKGLVYIPLEGNAYAPTPPPFKNLGLGKGRSEW